MVASHGFGTVQIVLSVVIYRHGGRGPRPPKVSPLHLGHRCEDDWCKPPAKHSWDWVRVGRGNAQFQLPSSNVFVFPKISPATEDLVYGQIRVSFKTFAEKNIIGEGYLFIYLFSRSNTLAPLVK